MAPESQQGSTLERLVIAPVVQAILGPSVLSDITDRREHTNLVCMRCHGKIAPEDPEPASVVLGVAENAAIVAWYAHATCMESQVYELDAPLTREDFAEVSFTAYPIARLPAATPQAMIVFEFGPTVWDVPPGTDRFKEYLLANGWEPVTDSCDRVSAGEVPGLCVARRDDLIVVRDKIGELIAFSNDVVPAEWWEIAAKEGTCLVLYGSGLGLDRFSIERIDVALQASRCAAAVASVESWAKLEVVARVDHVALLDEHDQAVISQEATVHMLTEGDGPDARARFVAVYDEHHLRCSPWFELTGPGISDLEAAIERAAESGASPDAFAAGLEALAAGNSEKPSESFVTRSACSTPRFRISPSPG